MSFDPLTTGLLLLVVVLAISNLTLVGILVSRSRAAAAAALTHSGESLHSLGRLEAALERTLGPERAAEHLAWAMQQIGGPPDEWDSDQLEQVNRLVRRRLASLVGDYGARVALASPDGESGVLAAQLRHLDAPAAATSTNWVRDWLYGLLRENPNGIVLLDPDRTIVLWSPRVSELTKLDAASVVGKPVDLLPPSLRPLFDHLDVDPVVEHALEDRVVAVRSRLLANQARLVVVADLTEARHRAHDDRLSEMGRLAAGLAHEIRSPLGGMLLAAHNLGSDLEEPEHRERLGRLMAEGRRIEAIVHALLDYSHPDTTTQDAVNLAEVAGEAAALVRLQHRHELAQLVIDVAPDLVVPGRASALLQILVNLLSNAAEASPVHGRIDIRGRRTDNVAILDVLDDGPGVDEAIVPRLFEPFVTSRPRGQGVGLGLSICRRIAEEHGGTIAYGREQARTRFRLTLPGASP